MKEEPKEDNAFWKKVGYVMKDKALEEEVEIEYTAPMQIMKSLVHSGLMRRVRVSKEKSEYKQFIFPSPLDAKIKFIAD